MGISFLRPFLQNICCNSPWNYAVFWKLKDDLVLTWEDGFCNVQKPPKVSAVGKFEDYYFEESDGNLPSTYGSCMPSVTPCNYPVGLAVAEMSNTSHVIGKGLVGEAILTRNAGWIYAGHINNGIFDYRLFSKYPDEWLLQFAAGIKTILLLPLVPYGVLQLGSVEVVAEDTDLLPRIKDVFVCSEIPWLADWRYSIRELYLTFTSLNASDEQATFVTENTTEDQTALHPENNFITEFLGLHDESDARIHDHMISMDGDYKPFVADNNIQNFKHHEELLKAAPCSEEIDLKVQGGWLEDLKLSEGENGEGYWFTAYDNCNLLSFPEEYELRNELGTVAKDEINIDVPALDHVEFPSNTVEMKPVLEASVVTASSSMDDNSSSPKSCITSLNTSEATHLVTPKRRYPSPPALKQDTWNISTSEFAANAINSISCSSPVSSVENKDRKLPGDQEKKRTHLSSNGGKVSRPSRTNKRKHCNGDNQKPRPRDRQLIQDRIKELRELVPNSEKCSIDGLLNKTIKHMLFLRGVTKQADKLKKHEANEKEARSTEADKASWAVDLGTEQQQQCPIVVKDLDQPGHMLIEMLCVDHDRFLNITDVIHRLQLTVLKGVMDRNSENPLARFIVETSGSFHRLDIFWPLMQLLQQNRAPITTKI